MSRKLFLGSFAFFIILAGTFALIQYLENKKYEFHLSDELITDVNLFSTAVILNTYQLEAVTDREHISPAQLSNLKENYSRMKEYGYSMMKKYNDLKSTKNNDFVRKRFPVYI